MENSRLWADCDFESVRRRGESCPDVELAIYRLTVGGGGWSLDAERPVRG